MEEEAAAYLEQYNKTRANPKPVVGFIAGVSWSWTCYHLPPEHNFVGVNPRLTCCRLTSAANRSPRSTHGARRCHHQRRKGQG